MPLRPEHVYRGRTGKMATKVRSMVRRMIIGATSRALWQVFGFERQDEESAPVFSGIGFYSRPRDDANAEVILLKVGGGAGHPVIVATRDESLRKALSAIRDLAADESAIYNSSARVHVKANGEVHVDSGSGAVALATKADIDSLQTAIDSHFHTTTAVTGGGGPVGVISPPTVPMPSAAGTSVLKGE